MKRKTTPEFIQQAIAVHGDKYDYLSVTYVNDRTKVKIICPKHGLFEQIPGSHLAGRGCLDCGGRKQKSQKDFIQQVVVIHGGKYRYDQCIYTKGKANIKIICPRHGVFEQRADRHARGHGCPSCGGSKPLDSAQFIERARSIHGDKYDYSKSIYINSNTKVDIICPEHGVFRQLAGHHLHGQGCSACGMIATRKSLSDDLDLFIQKARQVHGFRYDYSTSIYVNSKTKTKIACANHGVFEQYPSDHVNGVGCPSCAKTGFDSTKPGLLYFLKFEKPFVSFWKVGITNKTLRKRFNGDLHFVTSEYVWRFDVGAHAQKIEKMVLHNFQEYKFDSNFLFALLQSRGDTECFDLSIPHQKVIAFIEAKIRDTRTAIA